MQTLKRAIFTLLIMFFIQPSNSPLMAQNVKKVVLQCFWWDYKNNNFPYRWADYLTELAPRLKSMGIDAVWIPPTPKNQGQNWVGYGPFDAYDVGEKYQKGFVGTNMGTKDELMRLIAVMHANGIEVIQDIVLNHCDGAGTGGGAGGVDPTSFSVATNAGYKNFRYTCYETPTTTDNQADYWSRKGRWAKNYTNFYPNPNNNCTTGDICSAWFGPDFSYESNATGPSTNVSGYNPSQPANYTKDQANNWIIWYKKQTGVDGFRWDAVKHFPDVVQKDLSYNLKYTLPTWAAGGQDMFNVGEYVGSGGTLDGYCSAVRNPTTPSGTTNEIQMGTFDFGLRGFNTTDNGLCRMVMNNASGSFDLSTLLGLQQNTRYQDYGTKRVHRTVPFVNNHDTFRPTVNAAGNYTGWTTANELAAHIDPREPRLAAAHAVMMAMDGNPQIFLEDLFNLNNSNRFTHQPSDATQLPARADLVNLIWCHQNLDFKQGNYFVPYATADHLVLERGAKALVGITDQWSGARTNSVQSQFAAGTVLKDYSGANGSATATVGTGGWVSITTQPVGTTSATGHGYSVWAPVGQDADSYTPPRSATTTIEWEMADDLGDSHCLSLGYGGKIPNNSTNQRVAGRVFANAGTTVTYNLYPTDATKNLTIALYDKNGNQLATSSGLGALTGTYTAAATDYIVVKVRNTTNTYAGQSCYINIAYTAPTTVDTDVFPAKGNTSIWTGNKNTTDVSNCGNWEEGTMPTATRNVIIPAHSTPMPVVTATTPLVANNISIQTGASLTQQNGASISLKGDWTNNGTFASSCGTVSFNGTAAQQQILGSTPNTFCVLEVANPAGLKQNIQNAVSQELRFTSGKLLIDNYNFTILPTASITGASATQYVVCNDAPTASGSLVMQVGGTATSFPIGTSTDYTPATITNSGALSDFNARVFAGVLSNGNAGATAANAQKFVNRTWAITPTNASAIAAIQLNWNVADENPSLNRSLVKMYQNSGTNWSAKNANYAAAAGTNPYSLAATGISSFGFFSVGSAPLSPILVAPKMLLQGNFSTATMLMTDNLRAANHLPTTEPYTSLGIAQINGGGGEATAAAVLATTGSNAIVDWVQVILRDKTTPSLIKATKMALLQRDGDVVETDGISAVAFNTLDADNYYVQVRHRNHLAVCTAASLLLTTAAPTTVDFTNLATANYGLNAQNTVGSKKVLISGDANRDKQVNSSDFNAHWLPQNGQTYNYMTRTADFNLDAQVNSSDFNAQWVPNNSKQEQTP